MAGQNSSRSVAKGIELATKPTYAVPISLLSPPSTATREDHLIRAPDASNDSDRHGKMAGKKRKTSTESSSLKSVPGRVGLPQYAVPDSLLLPQTMHPSQTTFGEMNDPNRLPESLTFPRPEGSLPINSHPDQVLSALTTQTDAHGQSFITQQMNHKHSDNVMHASTQSRDKSPELAFQAKDLGIKYDCLNEISRDSYFPTPALTDPWGGAPTPNMSWGPTTDLHPLLDEAMPAVEPDAAMLLGARSDRTDLVQDRRLLDQLHVLDSTAPPLRDAPQLDTPSSTEARLSHVLQAVAAAGFDSLDDAIVTYYMNFVKNDERLRQEQRLSRIRRLPVLLKELHLAAQSWSQWQRRSFQEQIIRSTEDILTAELKDHLATKQPNQTSTRSSVQSEQGGRHAAGVETDIEAEFPNTWTLLTSLSTKYNDIASRDRQTDVPELVGKFLAAGIDLDS